MEAAALDQLVPIKIYRIQDKEGNGPFFYKDGTNKINPLISFKNNPEKYGFLKKEYFKESSYIDFFNNPNYILYEILLSKIVHTNGHEATFNENEIITIKKIGK